MTELPADEKGLMLSLIQSNYMGFGSGVVVPGTGISLQNRGTGFSLVGGRVAYLRQSPGAELIFQLRQHRISVFIFQEKDLADGLPTATGDLHELTFHVETWAQDGLRYFVVGDAGSDDIKALGQLLKRAAHS